VAGCRAGRHPCLVPGEQFAPALAEVLVEAVPQLYVTFPSEAGEPPAQLKAVQAVRLEPGQVSELGIEIPVDDLVIFSDGSRSRVVPGRYEIQLGASSADLRLKAAVQVP
jgi:beta-glucosidase